MGDRGIGAWAEDSFGNDDAADWAADFGEDPGLDRVREAVDEVLEEDDYVEADVGANCIAACEVLARLQGRWGEKSPYSEAIDEWVAANPQPVPGDLKADALRALDRLTADNSELRELWEDSEHSGQWHESMADLRKRVAGA